jgi:hypothetical protein
MATPASSALLNLTMRVERMTDVRGAMADTQKSFGFFLACNEITPFDNKHGAIIMVFALFW